MIVEEKMRICYDARHTGKEEAIYGMYCDTPAGRFLNCSDCPYYVDVTEL